MDRARRDLLATALWTVIILVVADLAANALFAPPADARRPVPLLPLYFHYGASVEAKLRRMVRERDEVSAPLASAGWLEPFNTGDAPLAAAPGKRLLAVYGQSFTFQVASAMVARDTGFTLRTRGGPSSPPGHAFALWSEDRPHVRADVAVLGVLASSVRGMDANSAAAWQFESPAPYTYPRYRLDGGGALVSRPPSVRSLRDLREALASPERWRAWVAEVERDDDWYDPLLWRASWLDRSCIARLLRRSWAQREQRAHLARLHDRHGFREKAESVRVLRALLAAFVEGCRRDGTLPVVLLVEDAGYSDHLSRSMGPALDGLGAAWLGTHELADAGNAANLKADGHFVDSLNDRLAAAVLARIRAEDSGALPGGESGSVPAVSGATGGGAKRAK